MFMPEEWIVWNRYRETVQRAVINDLRPWKHGATGRLDGLEYDDIGRIPVDTLMSEGHVEGFGYYIMSSDYWRQNECRLRQQFAKDIFAEGAKAKLASEMILGFSRDEELTKENVNDAYRLAAQSAHPDRGGDAALFTLVQNARAELLKKIETQDSLADDIPF
jgi:hypothetical protein